MAVTLRWECFPLGALETNCYLIWCPETLEGLLLDPGDTPEEPLELAEREGIHIRALVATHGHFDHVAGVETAKKRLRVGFLIHPADRSLAANPPPEAALIVGCPTHPAFATGELTEGMELAFGECSLRVIETPGHTPGCVSLLGPGIVFSGDTLFHLSMGRTDLEGGDPRLIVQSIQERLLTLDPSTRVLPGHGPDTTIAIERSENPFVG